MARRHTGCAEIFASRTVILRELINFLREQLKNHFIEIELDLIENPDEEVKFLNGNDKFEALSKKNPKLITLKNLFNLDIEF